MLRSILAKVTTLPAVALCVVFVAAVWERFRLPLTPFADPDVWAYLGPALDALLGQPFREWFGQCFLYPWLVYSLLRTAASFSIITVVQSLLGLGTGALLFACWMQLRAFLPASRTPVLAFKLCGVLLAALYLFSTATIQFERTLRPEVVFSFVVVLQIYCNLHFIRARFFDAGSWLAFFSGGLAIFLAFAAWLLKPSFTAVVLLGNLPVIVSLFRGGETVLRKVFSISAPLAAAFLLLIWPEWKLRQIDPAGPRYLAESLFSVHADLINKQLAEDLASHPATAYAPELLAAVHTALTQALGESAARQRRYWRALGFNPDDLRFGINGQRPFIGELTDWLGGKEQTHQFFQYYYWRTVRGQPIGMMSKIARQFWMFYRPGYCRAYYMPPKLDLAREYERTHECFAIHQELQRCPPGAAVLRESAALTDSPVHIGPYRVPALLHRLLTATHSVWCLWAIVLALLVWKRPAIRREFGTMALILIFLYLYNFGTVLTLAIGHTLDVVRYSQYQLVYTLLPDFVSIWLAAEVYLAVAERWKRAAA